MIRWPEKHDPKNTPVHVRNEIDIDAPPENVWSWLIHAPLWPTWYSNSSNVVIEGGNQDLAMGTKFRWRTFRVNLASEVREFVPMERLAWTAKAAGIDAYHAWLIERRGAGSHVITEETQDGFVAKLNAKLRPKDMSAGHQAWLEALGERAKSR
jgi:uncharacterized protein YndB with AHSA1/START domain